MSDASTEAAGTPTPATGQGTGLSPRLWLFIIVSAIVFIALAISIANILSAPFYPARFIDADATRLTPGGAAGTTLHVGLKYVANKNAFTWDVIPNHPEHEGLVVEIKAAPGERQDKSDQNTELFLLEIPLPNVDRVTVLDLRWARVEGLVVEREAGR